MKMALHPLFRSGEENGGSTALYLLAYSALHLSICCLVSLAGPTLKTYRLTRPPIPDMLNQLWSQLCPSPTSSPDSWVKTLVKNFFCLVVSGHMPQILVDSEQEEVCEIRYF